MEALLSLLDLPSEAIAVARDHRDRDASLPCALMRSFSVTCRWARAFAALAAAGVPVMLAGRAIRVANADPAGLAEVLEAAGIEASLEPVPATISERMLMLSRQGKAS